MTTELPDENGLLPTVIVTVVPDSFAPVIVTGVAAPATVRADDATAFAALTVPLVLYVESVRPELQVTSSAVFCSWSTRRDELVTAKAPVWLSIPVIVTVTGRIT